MITLNGKPIDPRNPPDLVHGDVLHFDSVVYPAMSMNPQEPLDSGTTIQEPPVLGSGAGPERDAGGSTEAECGHDWVVPAFAEDGVPVCKLCSVRLDDEQSGARVMTKRWDWAKPEPTP